MTDNQMSCVTQRRSIEGRRPIRWPENAHCHEFSTIELPETPWTNYSSTWSINTPTPPKPPTSPTRVSTLSQPIKFDRYVEYLLLALTFTSTFSNVAIISHTNTLSPLISSDLQTFTAHLTALIFTPAMASAVLSPASLTALIKLLVYPTICLVAGQISAAKGHGRKSVVLVSMAGQILFFTTATVLLTYLPAVTGKWAGLALIEAGYALQVVAVRPLSREINTVFFTGATADLLSDKDLWRGLWHFGSVPAVRRRAGLLFVAVTGAVVGQAVSGAIGTGMVLCASVGLRVLIMVGIWYADTEAGLPR